MSLTIVSRLELAAREGKVRQQPGSRLVRLVTDAGSGCPPGTDWSGLAGDVVGPHPGGAAR